MKVLLFEFITDQIKITIEAYFDNDGNLLVEGYDIGETVNEYWGDVDYEYSITIPPDQVAKLYTLLNLSMGDQVQLLAYLQQHYNTNTCYSEIRNWLERNDIKHQGFSWT